jgi:hypothetical protein
MILTETEYRSFISIHLNLIYYAGLEKEVLNSNMTFAQFLKLKLQVKTKCRDQLNKNSYLIDNFLRDYSESLTSEKIKIIQGFKQKIDSDFIILKCLKNNAIFIDPNDQKVYAVKALSDRFDTFFDFFPVYVNTTLIPYNDKIIYDGFMTSHRVVFGKNYRYEFNEIYKNAKESNAIIRTM